MILSQYHGSYAGPMSERRLYWHLGPRCWVHGMFGAPVSGIWKHPAHRSYLCTGVDYRMHPNFPRGRL